MLVLLCNLHHFIQLALAVANSIFSWIQCWQIIFFFFALIMCHIYVEVVS
uniref:Uncharacterized protein n=1 Tax=Rhizophora mucronata TaxID=61149 RepID=A0A2P2P117_RHIMU